MSVFAIEEIAPNRRRTSGDVASEHTPPCNFCKSELFVLKPLPEILEDQFRRLEPTDQRLVSYLMPRLKRGFAQQQCAEATLVFVF